MKLKIRKMHLPGMHQTARQAKTAKCSLIIIVIRVDFG